MGFTPEQIDRMSLWEFNQTCAGWEKFYCRVSDDERVDFASKEEIMDMFANEQPSNGERISYKPKQ